MGRQNSRTRSDFGDFFEINELAWIIQDLKKLPYRTFYL